MTDSEKSGKIEVQAATPLVLNAKTKKTHGTMWFRAADALGITIVLKIQNAKNTGIVPSAC